MRIAIGARQLSALLMISCCWITCFFVGCGGSAGAFDTTPVSGVVTCDGKPIANATINFTPNKRADAPPGQRGKLALGMTDKDGKFRLTTYENYDGAIIGFHTVTVSSNMNENTGRAARLKCDGKSLEVEVKKGIKEYTVEF